MYTYQRYLCSYLICTQVVCKELYLEAKVESQMQKIDSTLQKMNQAGRDLSHFHIDVGWLGVFLPIQLCKLHALFLFFVVIISADAKNAVLGHYSNLGKKRRAGSPQLNGQRKRRVGTNQYKTGSVVSQSDPKKTHFFA